MDEGQRKTVGSGTSTAHHEIATPDGRTLHYSLYGPEHGPRVVCHNGTPGTRLLSPSGIELIERLGVRVLIADRPGYGGSTRQPNRRIADVAPDIELIADGHGWETFGTWGGSGGGPHALACAALLPKRVTRCATVGGLAPYGTDFEWFANMSPGNVEEFKKAIAGEAVYRPLVEQLGRKVLAQVEHGAPAIPLAYGIPASDMDEMRRRLTADPIGLIERTRRAWVDGADGWIDDCIAMVHPWGFDVARIDMPVSVWYGSDDVLSPRGHAEWLIANIREAERRMIPGGHMLADDAFAETLRWATA